MHPHDKKRFAEILFSTMEIYDKQPSKRSVGMYWNILSGFPIEQVEAAFTAHLTDPKDGKFQPKPADIVRHIVGTKEDRKTQAEAAWHRVTSNLDRYNSAVFDDPAIHYALMIGFGSWETVCDFDQDKFACQQSYRSFISAYMSYSGQPYMPRLAGIYEIAAALGPTQYEVHYHGDKDRALAVESGGRSGSMAEISKEVIKAIEVDQ